MTLVCDACHAMVSDRPYPTALDAPLSDLTPTPPT